MSTYQPPPASGAAWRPGSCSWCGEQGFDAGFLEDVGGAGATRWVVGALERGPLGGVRLLGRQRLALQGFRCRTCGHVELFAQ